MRMERGMRMRWRDVGIVISELVTNQSDFFFSSFIPCGGGAHHKYLSLSCAIFSHSLLFTLTFSRFFAQIKFIVTLYNTYKYKSDEGKSYIIT